MHLIPCGISRDIGNKFARSGEYCKSSISVLPTKLDHTLARKNDSPTWCGVIVVVWCYCGGVVLLW